MRVLLVPNTLNPAAVAATVELATWLVGAGVHARARDGRRRGVRAWPTTASPPTEIGEPVLVVALGGDGTILKAVHLLGEAEVPVLGVKFGRLGFLSGASAGSMREAVGTALAGEARIERRATLQGRGRHGRPSRGRRTGRSTRSSCPAAASARVDRARAVDRRRTRSRGCAPTA